ncbi:MAG TPA: Flp family type IVb pilin [Caulobacteraceae bacterium]|jgi:pilus assembly protein Flp/PilA
MSRIVSYLKDDNGASAAEYALLLAIVTTALAGAVTGLGTAIQGAITAATDVIAPPAG